MVLDGPALVGEALDADVSLEAVFVEESASARPDIAGLIDRAEAVGIKIWELPDGALSRLTDVVHPPGLAAIASWAPAELTGPTLTSLVLVLAGVTDPGNAGTLLRSAEAGGCSAVVFCGDAVDPTNPKCVRASAGALFHTAVVVRSDATEVLDELGGIGYRRIATRTGSGDPYDQVDLAGRVAVVLGSEAHGLPSGLDASIDATLTIPMDGRSESLNVAMAGAVLCFEALRQRRAGGARTDVGRSRSLDDPE